MLQEYIEIRGARENNLKNISRHIPKRNITVFTGVSGSGKSSIVFDTIAGLTVAMNDGQGMKYLLTDHLGSVAAITDDEGTLLDQQRYLPFGGVRPNVGSVSQTDFGYTGQRNIASTGLMDYKARMYDPLLSRFIQPDPIIPNAGDPQSWNRYSYVNNSPLVLVDPSGHFGKCKDGMSDYSCKQLGSRIKNLEKQWDEASSAPETSTPPSSAPGSFQHSWGCAEIDPASCTPAIIAATGSAGAEDPWKWLYEIHDLMNWSETTPGEMTIYRSGGYPMLGGVRVFYQPFFTENVGSQLSLSPRSIGVGSMVMGFNGEFRYKQGLNSVSAVNLHLPWNFQPWALKVSMDTTLTSGDYSATHRIGYEYVARPDNWAYVAAGAFAVATYGVGVRVLQTLGSRVPQIPVRSAR